MLSPGQLDRLGIGHFPGHIGMLIKQVSESEIRAELPITTHLIEPARPPDQTLRRKRPRKLRTPTNNTTK